MKTTHSIVITRSLLGTYTVHASNYDTGVTIKSCLWRTEAEAEAEAERIELSWKYGSLPTTSAGVA